MSILYTFYKANRVKFIFVLSIIIPFILAPANIISAQAEYKIKTVVIDPGHGGKDNGAVGNYSREKDLVLDISLKLGAYINKYLPDVKVIYTRKKDVFIPLHKRAAIANESKADLFISVHINANPSSRPYGTETFVMGLHKSEKNLEVAKLENAAILHEEDYEQNYDGFDPNSPEGYATLSLFQHAFLDQSLDLAAKIEDQFKNRVRRHSRGVKQAGFLVLWRTTMPSVLIEAGFISNSKEERFLNSKKGTDYLASAIYRAFRDYKLAFEKKSEWIAQDAKEKNTEEKNIIETTSVEKKKDTKPVVETPKETEQKKIVSEKSKDKKTQDVKKNNSKKTEKIKLSSNIYFKIQLTSSSNPIPLSDKSFSNLSHLEELRQGSLYKYASGKYTSYMESLDQSKKIKTRFPDAFIIAVKNGEIISVSKALNELDELN